MWLHFPLLGSDLSQVFFLFQYLYEFLDALLMSQTTPEEVLEHIRMSF